MKSMKRQLLTGACGLALMAALPVSTGAGVVAPSSAAQENEAAAPGENGRALAAYRQELSQSLLTWGEGTVDCSTVSFALADLNNDGVSELMIEAIEGVVKSQNDGYYELWSWDGTSLHKDVSFSHWKSPVSYDPAISLVYVEGAIKGMWYYEYYTYDAGTLTLFLSYLENPDGYGSAPPKSYSDRLQSVLTQEEYESRLQETLEKGSGLRDFVFVKNTPENRGFYLGEGEADSGGNAVAVETPVAEETPANPWREGGTAIKPVQETKSQSSEDTTIHRYEIYVEDVSWEEAARRCEEMGGYLAQINSEEEYQSILSLLEQYEYYTDKVYYLGGMRAPSDTLYYWTDRYGNPAGDGALNTPDSWAYCHWGPGEPSYTDRGIDECYLSLFKYQGVWILNDEPASMLQTAPEYAGYIGFICEKETAVHYDTAYGETSASPGEVLSGLPSLVYTSGAGAWDTTIDIASDGSFTGLYHDADNATLYICRMRGQFNNLRQVSEGTWSMEIAWLEKSMVDQSEYPGLDLVYSEHTGLEAGDTVLFYRPGIPMSDTTQSFQEWIRIPLALQEGAMTTLDRYGLYDINQDSSFISFL